MKVAKVLLLVTIGLLTNTSCTQANAKDQLSSDLENKQFRESHCMLHSDGDRYYKHHVAEEGKTQPLPSDFALHGLKMKDGENLAIADQGTWSTNKLQAIVDAPKDIWKFRYYKGFDPENRWEVDKYKVVCRVYSKSPYQTIGDPGRSTSLKDKRLGRPKVTHTSLIFPFVDSKDQSLEYGCSIVDIKLFHPDYVGRTNTDWRDGYSITKIKINDLIEIMQNSGLIEGVMCPATLIQGQDLDATNENVVL